MSAEPNLHAIDNEKLDYLEAQPASDDEAFTEDPPRSNRRRSIHSTTNNDTCDTTCDNNEKTPSEHSNCTSSRASSYHGRFPFYHHNKSLVHYVTIFLVCTGPFVPAIVIHKETSSFFTFSTLRLFGG
jgi:hypothetical protein